MSLLTAKDHSLKCKQCLLTEGLLEVLLQRDYPSSIPTLPATQAGKLFSAPTLLFLNSHSVLVEQVVASNMSTRCGNRLAGSSDCITLYQT